MWRLLVHTLKRDVSGFRSRPASESFLLAAFFYELLYFTVQVFKYIDILKGLQLLDVFSCIVGHLSLHKFQEKMKKTVSLFPIQ